MSKLRLDKFIASQLNISRKDSRTAIRRGQVSINDETVRNPELLIEAEKDNIAFLGKTISYKEHVYIVMNKPKGVLSASEDKTRQTVVDLVPDELKRKGLFPVGRLDKDTTGLLIITDDGEFAHNLLSPQKNIYKTYIAVLDGEITDSVLETFKNEIVLADGTVCRKAYLKKLSANTAEIKICEGRYHQIKRMFGVVGLGVDELQRKAIGSFNLPDDLSVGSCIELKREEIASAFVNIDHE